MQLIFLNLLIAIMDDTFGRITAIMDQSALKELCSFMVFEVTGFSVRRSIGSDILFPLSNHGITSAS